MRKRISQSLLPLILSGLVLIFSGCDNGDDISSDSGSAVATSDASADLNAHLTTAINDEYRARNTYIGVMNKFGQVKPFVNIKKAEEQHIDMLVNLFNKYGLSVPANTVAGLATPATLRDACALGVQAEIENARLYDDLLAGTGAYPDVQTVFRQLRSASQDQHLPAFQRCAN
jgi:hypothetical protein